MRVSTFGKSLVSFNLLVNVDGKTRNQLDRSMNSLYEITTPESLLSPSLVIFEPLVRENIAEMIRVAGNAGRLRPHCKTHKMAQMVRMSMDMGISRQKCATIAEAEMLANAGCKDIFVAYQLVGPNVVRFVQLVDKYPHVKFTAMVDHPKCLSALSDELCQRKTPIDVLIDLDSGMSRSGIPIGEDAIELYQSIDARSNLNAAGFHWYDGHHRQVEYSERKNAVQRGWSRFKDFQASVEKTAKPVERVVAGGTGSFPALAEIDDPILELSPGTVIFFDEGYRRQFPEMNFVPAALLLTRVVGNYQTNRLTLDLGHKAVAADPAQEKRAFFPELPEAKIVMQNEEHLVIETEKAAKYTLGDELLAIPWHICPTTALHEFVYLVDESGCVTECHVDARNRHLTV